jgi:16S rRNA (uracil1498-N3)-methyltransferase
MNKMTKPNDPGRRIPRFYCDGPLAIGMSRDLPGDAAHHAARVLRMKTGDALRIFCGDDHEWDSVITRVDRDRVSVLLTHAQRVSVEPPFQIALAQGMSSREKMDLTLQKATELGVMEIFPVVTQRSVIKLDEDRADRRVEHWQAIVASACEQCGRNTVPKIHRVYRFETWISTLIPDAAELRLLLSPASSTRLRDIPKPQRVLLLVGPEGGLTEDERSIAARFGFQSIVLGPRVLRTETAALAAVSAMHALWGDF